MSTDKPGTEEGLVPPAAGSPAHWAERAVMRCSSAPFTQRTICQSCATHSIQSALAEERRRVLARVRAVHGAEWEKRIELLISGPARREPPSESVAAAQDDRQEGKPGDIRTEAIRDCAAVARNTGREYERDKRRAKLAGDNEEVIFLDGMVRACARVAAKLDDLTVPKALTTERIEDDIQF